MNSQHPCALVVCPEDSAVNRVVAGLTVGERLLMALTHGGIGKVAFDGDGPRPESARAKFEEVSLEDLAREECQVLVLPCDLVFDRGILGDISGLGSDYPIWVLGSSERVEAASGGFIDDVAGRAVHGGKGYAFRVTGDESADLARMTLFKSLVKPADGFISRHVNRKFSLAITSLLINTPLTPNQLTVFSILLGVASGVAAYFAEYWWALVLAGVLFQGQSMLDGCDGEIARLKYRFSLAGQWLDSVSDDITNYAFFLGLGLGQARVMGWQWLEVVAWAGFAIQWYASIIMYQRIYKMNTGDLLAIPNMVTGGEPKGVLGAAARVIHTMTKRDFFVFVTSILVAAGFPLVSFFIILGGACIMAPSLTLNEVRIRRALKDGTLEI